MLVIPSPQEPDMFPANAYTIRGAAGTDAEALDRLAELDSQRPLRGHVLVAEVDGVLIAAYGTDEQRAIADPFRPTAPAVILLRSRAGAIAAVTATPSLRDR